MKIAKTYKDFCKINRKYYKKNMVKRVDHINNKRFVSYWEYKDWVGYIVKSFDEYITKKIYAYVKSVVGPDICLETRDKVLYLYNNTDKTIEYKLKGLTEGGKFIGIILTNRDAYYAVNDNGQHKLIPMHWNFDIK